MKIHPVGTELFHADRRTGGETDGRDESNNRFTQFCERSQNGQKLSIILFSVLSPWQLGNKLRINLQVIRNNYYSEQSLYLFMNPLLPYSVLKYYESKCTATSLSSSPSLFIFFPHAISSQQTNFAPAVSAPQKKPYFFYFSSPFRLLLFA